ncbi:MAG: hypothetical protein HY704_13280 [Gemmatimonadetes bacterium]|nr:hypothetical protein [Gemmatimonadota bacterium]
MNRTLRTTGLALLVVVTAGLVAALLVRDQIHRHRRDLFSPKARRRLAALGAMSRREANVVDIRLLRDFIASEPRPLLRARARALLGRMEREARGMREPSPERAG